MTRHTFLKLIAFALGGAVMPVHAKSSTRLKMAAFFVGHGSPMNAVADNAFTRSLRAVGEQIQKPEAILMVSAHWMPPFYGVSVHEKRDLMYDFFGFPEALYEVQYPAPNAAFLRPKMEPFFEKMRVVDRPLDHGAWTVLKHLFPEADIPVMQFGIPKALTFKEHFELGRRLGALRDQGVMIIGSGNITHNLSKVDSDEAAPAQRWARDFDAFVAQALKERDFDALIEVEKRSPDAALAHPTWEHYIPLLYVAGASRAEDTARFPYEGIEHGSLSMRNWLLT